MKSKKVSKKETIIVEQKKKKISWLPITALIIIIIMVGSSLVLMKDQDGDSYDFNGFSVTKTEQGWGVSKGQGSLLFLYDPKSLQDIPADKFSLTNNKVYLILDDNYTQESSVLKGYLNKFGIPVNDACFSEENCPDIPLVTCDSTSTVIYFKEGNNSIAKDNKCVILNTDAESKHKLVDVFIYKLMGAL